MDFDQLMEMHGPPQNSVGQQYDKLLKNMKGDIDKLIEDCSWAPYKANKEYKLIAGSDQAPSLAPSLTEKNQKAIEHSNIAGSVIYEMERQEKLTKLNERRALPKTFATELDHLKPQDGKILITELSKALFLNSQDAKKYNLEFFARYFNIEPRLLRNVFNYVSYPIVDENTGDIVQMLRFNYNVDQ